MFCVILCCQYGCSPAFAQGCVIGLFKSCEESRKQCILDDLVKQCGHVKELKECHKARFTYWFKQYGCEWDYARKNGAGLTGCCYPSLESRTKLHGELKQQQKAVTISREGE
ncbi:hypothetical protein niasHS_001464 [Heterodera schachtii]|uniref:Uncharacterized protein n=1 Tax=Heterodera schachtii TaxID=97005 RepID=A0ABD2KES8_HETSC